MIGDAIGAGTVAKRREEEDRRRSGLTAAAGLLGTGMLAAISAVLTADPQTGGGGPAVGLGLMAGMFLGAAAILGVLVWRGRLLRRVRDAAKQQRRAQL
ncbi:hypothetical protein [Arthrobacter sunyaminii]|uniref:hypothetical protein n=1 Tax=Arthrobacter sunyaminii TaxID=2816859 RepID=UPI001A94F226|nr:hypothetical protein [Arthrobacter sunyaminii]MBO0895323.1 hypothetical protein [Arthrobacter sunyaminii]